jgi:hypothetical protein
MSLIFRLSLVITLGIAAPSLAYKNGNTGVSGEHEGPTCNMCHSGGSAPQVELSGPATLEAGGVAAYRLLITGGAARVGGLNVALDDATAALVVMEANTQVKDGELTHLSPMAFTNGMLAVDFVVIAPAKAGTLTLYAAGNSCNDNGQKTGDQAANTSMAITITPASKTDGGTQAAADGGQPGVGGGGEQPRMTGGCAFAGAPSSTSPLVLLMLLLPLCAWRAQRKRA